MAHDFPEYEEIPHTADLQIIAYGKSVEDLFINAAKGMFNAAGAVGDNLSCEIRRIELKANDLETLLVSFLEELLFLSEAGWLSEVQELNIFQTNLSGEIHYFKIKAINKEIKAVTYHDMNISQEDGVFQTKITFDV